MAMVAGGRRQQGNAASVAGLLVTGRRCALAPAAQAQNLTYSEVKFGRPRRTTCIFSAARRAASTSIPKSSLQSPVADAWAATVPAYLRWMVQPRPTIGGEINTSGFTNQAYFGATWTWQLAGNVLQAGRRHCARAIFSGPASTMATSSRTAPDRKSLGSHVLFREALELGYLITPVYQVSALLDHVSNGGLAKQNQSINDLGVRFGVRF